MRVTPVDRNPHACESSSPFVNTRVGSPARHTSAAGVRVVTHLYRVDRQALDAVTGRFRRLHVLAGARRGQQLDVAHDEGVVVFLAARSLTGRIRGGRRRRQASPSRAPSQRRHRRRTRSRDLTDLAPAAHSVDRQVQLAAFVSCEPTGVHASSDPSSVVAGWEAAKRLCGANEPSRGVQDVESGVERGVGVRAAGLGPDRRWLTRGVVVGLWSDLDCCVAHHRSGITGVT